MSFTEPEVHYRVHNSAPVVPNLRQMNQIHHIKPYCLDVYCIILFPSTPRFYKLFLRLSHWIFYALLNSPNSRYVPWPPHPQCLDQPNMISATLQVMQFSIFLSLIPLSQFHHTSSVCARFEVLAVPNRRNITILRRDAIWERYHRFRGTSCLHLKCTGGVLWKWQHIPPKHWNYQTTRCHIPEYRKCLPHCWWEMKFPA